MKLPLGSRFMAAALAALSPLCAQTPGQPDMPVQVIGGDVDQTRHDGGLSPVVGIETIQVLRANRTHPEWADGFGFTYNHAPMICYWHGRFYLEWLSNTYGEQVAPGHTLVATSADGRTWSKPAEVFPIYSLDVPPFKNAVGEPGTAIMHQRMGFYVAPNGRLLVCAFYGGTPSPFGPGGIGRVVREAHDDGTYGPLYFIKYNEHYQRSATDSRVKGTDLTSLPGWNEANTAYPFTPGTVPMPIKYFKHSPDAGFVEACDALLADKLKTMQWWEEEGEPQTLFKLPDGRMRRWEAPSVYHRPDGTAVSVWKWSGAALSTDEGAHWSNVVRVPSIITAGAKVWGQKLTDGRFALVYNPANDGYHRWPLTLASGKDGITFDHMLLVDGDVYPRRYMGRAKDYGFQYIRGISEGNGSPPDKQLWLTYSTKEDIWVSRVTVPIRGAVSGPVADNFNAIAPQGILPDWNIRRGPWTDVAVVDFPGQGNHSLRLSDSDPYNYARAERIFAAGTSTYISVRIYPHQSDHGQLNVEVMGPSGRRAVRIVFGSDGKIRAAHGTESTDLGSYRSDHWHDLSLTVDASAGTYTAQIDRQPAAAGIAFFEKTEQVNRLSFRTGDLFELPTRETSRDLGGRDVVNPGEPGPTATYNIDDVAIR